MTPQIVQRVGTALKYRLDLARARRIGFRYDDESRARHAEASAELTGDVKRVFDDLKANGYAKLDWFKDVVGEMGTDVAGVFERAPRQDNTVVGQNIKHPFLFSPVPGEIIHSEKLNQVLKAYIGPAATFDFSQIMRIPATTNHQTLSGLWHHDRVGLRVKLFVYLHDVMDTGRVTHYAKGSHDRNIQGWSHAASRGDDAEIKRNFDVSLLTGRKGEAYLFDTNGMHRAVWEKNDTARDVLYFEWSQRQKATQLRALGYHIGVCRELFPEGFSFNGTLVDGSMLRPGGEYTLYGQTAPKFNFVHDPTARKHS